MRQDILTSREKQKTVNFVSEGECINYDQPWESRDGLKRQAVSVPSPHILGKADISPGVSIWEAGQLSLVQSWELLKE